LGWPGHLKGRRLRVNEAVVKHAVLQPSVALRPFVKRFEVVQSLAERMHTLVPNTSLVACFRLDGVVLQDGSSTLPTAILSGLQDRARVFTHLAGSHVLLTMFTEAGAAAFLREPLDLLFNQTTPMDCLVRRPRLNELQERLMESRDYARKTAVIERFLLGELRSERPDPVAEVVATHIQKRHGNVRMEKLARAMGLSLSALERRFRRNVGASPRKFASIVRVQHVIRLRKAGGNLTEIAHRAGYFDQSHFIKDFKNFTGLAPESFFREFSSSW
jgi:AraC-like DNA-binding protein